MKPRLVQPLGPWPEYRPRVDRQTLEEQGANASARYARYREKKAAERKAYCKAWRQRQKQQQEAA